MTLETDAFELEGRARVLLYSIILPDATAFFLSPKQSWTWRGDLYEEHPVHMSQVKRQADGTVSRPKVTIANPQSLFSAQIATGVLENARITRHQIMKTDLEADLPMAVSEVLRVSRVASLNHQTVVLDLRGPLDGANFRIPFRAFHPPEFPHVSLS